MARKMNMLSVRCSELKWRLPYKTHPLQNTNDGKHDLSGRKELWWHQGNPMAPMEPNSAMVCTAPMVRTAPMGPMVPRATAHQKIGVAFHLEPLRRFHCRPQQDGEHLWAMRDRASGRGSPGAVGALNHGARWKAGTGKVGSRGCIGGGCCATRCGHCSGSGSGHARSGGRKRSSRRAALGPQTHQARPGGPFAQPAVAHSQGALETAQLALGRGARAFEPASAGEGCYGQKGLARRWAGGARTWTRNSAAERTQ